MKNTKKLIALTLAVVLMALTIAACGGNGGDTQQQPEGNNPDTQEQPNGGEPTPMDSGGDAPTPEPVDDPTPPPATTGEIGDIIQFGGYDWRVLDVQDGKALIISEGILERRAFRADWESDDANSWASSDIRAYLNGEFYDSTFSDAEKQQIADTALTDVESTDNVFLLSADEAEAYFADSPARVAAGSDGEASWWWLRSPNADFSHSTYRVDSGGDIRDLSDSVGFDGGVRPALWLNLD